MGLLILALMAITAIVVIVVIVGSLGFITFAILPRSIKLLKIHLKQVDKRIEAFEKEQQPPKEAPQYNSMQGKWSPTGWVYNTKTGKWDPPDYLAKESSDKWRWNEEKQIWVDVEKEKRLERYRKNREGKPPSYEEWKAAKLAEQHNTEE